MGTAATSAALPHDAARLHFGTVPPGRVDTRRVGARSTRAALGAGRQSGGAFRVLRRAAPQRPATCCIVAPHRRARIPAPRQETPRHRKMRFHRVIILEAVAPRGVIRSAAMNCGLPRSSRWPGRGEKRTRSRFLPMPVKISFPCEAREASDTALPLENQDKGSKENRVRPPHRKRKGHTECGVPFSTSWGG